MARTMLFISISPKRSARITVPWTALIYVPAPRPPLNLAGSCRDALIGRELETGSPGGRRACLHASFCFFPSKVSPPNQTGGRQICPRPSWFSLEVVHRQSRVGSADPCWWEHGAAPWGLLGFTTETLVSTKKGGFYWCFSSDSG